MSFLALAYPLILTTSRSELAVYRIFIKTTLKNNIFIQQILLL